MEWISDDYYVSAGVIFVGSACLVGLAIFFTRFIDFDPDTDSAVKNLENKMLREAEFARNVFIIIIYIHFYIVINQNRRREMEKMQKLKKDDVKEETKESKVVGNDENNDLRKRK